MIGGGNEQHEHKLLNISVNLASDVDTVRRSAIEKLKNEDTDKSVEILKHVANGGGRIFIKMRRFFRPWKSYQKPIEYFHFEDQMLAIMTLSTIKNEKAINFILSLGELEVSAGSYNQTPSEAYGGSLSGDGGWVYEYSTGQLHFRNARGDLSEHLRMDDRRADGEFGMSGPPPQWRTISDGSFYLPNNHVGITIKNAMAQAILNRNAMAQAS